MFKKMLFALIIFVPVLLYFNCQKNSDSITGFWEDDTSDNGGPVVRKPNIYIYPTEKINLEVQLKFPHGGQIIKSYPEYSNGWNITVEPSGLINDQYQYLFYEARIPEILQRENGWVVKGEELEDFFVNNLSHLLFSEKEISDFIEYWIPLLENDKTYLIYPHFTKELSDIIDMHFSIPPDNVIRVLYLIEEYSGDDEVKIPQIPLYKREGLTVLEWGVVY
jgi:hypothetical protein